ncbi:MAG: hypothetical protein GY869_31275, partial [Planctomycetes bacterium]|nr:hypothetical protein [Planctomycetota bacterium]
MNPGKYLALLILTIVMTIGCSGPANNLSLTSTSDYQDLLNFFRQWREFQKPNVVDGIPDYTAPAMTRQKKRIPEFKKRLAAIDPGSWPIPQQADYHVVRAE